MSNREIMIERLTEYELAWLVDNPDKHSIAELAEFFSNGGFNAWTDEQLLEKYNKFILED